MNSQWFKYLPALFTVLVWGSTFVASKHVLDAGVSPMILMTLRFVMAYVLMLAVSRERMHIEWNMTELKLLIVGVCGGSVYFLVEYMALQRTSAVNVGLISATVPVVSTAIDLVLKRQRPRWTYVTGSVVAFVGVLLLVTDGKLLIDIFPVGDALAVLSSVMWAIYTVVLSRIDSKMPEKIVERRMLFYSLVTILPVAIVVYDHGQAEALMSGADVWLSAIYLGVMASAVCLWLWNVSINRIGIVRTNNFLYLLPVVSLVASALLMDGEVTMVTVVSTVLILIGIVVADK